MMREPVIAVSYLPFLRENSTVLDVFKLARAFGFRYMTINSIYGEVGLIPLSRFREDFNRTAESFSRLFEKFSLYPVAFSIDTVEDLVGLYHRLRDREFREFLKIVFRIASFFEASTVSIRKLAFRNRTEEEIHEMIVRLRTLARKYNVKLALNTHRGTVLEDINFALDVVQSFSDVYLAFEPATYVTRGIDFDSYKVLLPYTQHLVVYDADRGDENIMVEFGKGSVPFSKIVDELIDMGFDGPFTIEYFKFEKLNIAYDGDPIEDSLRARAFLENAIKKRLHNR